MTPTISHPIIRGLAAGAAVLWLTAGPAAADVPASGVPTTGIQPNVAAQPVVVATTTAAVPPAKAAVVKAGASGAAVTLNDPKCTKFTLTGTAPNQRVTCQ